MSNDQHVEIEREYRRIGLTTVDRLPMPRGLRDESDYLRFLRQVPDASGVQGFTATMTQRANGP
jgi:hypothetical protein